MRSFVVSEKTKLDFEFIIGGEKKVESIFIDFEDKGLADRLKFSKEELEKKISEIKIEQCEIKSSIDFSNLNSFEDFSSLDDQQIEDLGKVSDAWAKVEEDLSNACIKQLCESFGTDVSNAFKYIKPFDIINGDYYVYLFIEAIADEIIARRKKEVAAAQKAVKNKPYMQNYVNERSNKSKRKKR